MKNITVKFLGGFLSAAFVFGVLPAVAANIDASFNSVNIRVNNLKVADESKNYALPSGKLIPNSIVYKGTTYIPVRRIGETLGLDVGYDVPTNTAVISSAEFLSPKTEREQYIEQLNYVLDSPGRKAKLDEISTAQERLLTELQQILDEISNFDVNQENAERTLDALGARLEKCNKRSEQDAISLKQYFKQYGKDVAQIVVPDEYREIDSKITKYFDALANSCQKYIDMYPDYASPVNILIKDYPDSKDWIESIKSALPEVTYFQQLGAK